MSDGYITAVDVRNALMRRFSDSRRYAIAEEVGITTGGGCRRLDMIVMDCYWSNNFRIDGFEIKISTSDLRRELEDPNKHTTFFDVLDYYTLACPAAVVNPLIDIIPKKWGILIINEDGTTRYKRKPLALFDDKMPDRKISHGFVASITRAIQERQPAEHELAAKYKAGIEEGRKRAEEHRGYLERKVQEGAEKIAAYEKLESRFNLWRGQDDLDKILDDFEAFRKLDPYWVRQSLENAIKKLEDVKGYMEGKTEEQQPEPDPQQNENNSWICPFCASAYVEDNATINCRRGLSTDGRKECGCFTERG